MRNQHQLIQEVLTAIVVFAAMAATGTAHAQFGNGCGSPLNPCFVNDVPTENSVQDIDTAQLPPVVSSLTTAVNSSYQSNASFIASLDSTMFAGVNPQNDAQLMPVTQGLPCDSYDPMVSQIAPALMNTYEAAITVTQQLMTELQNESIDTIAGNVAAPYELGATQADGQTGLAIIQELQMMRAQLGALTMIEATDKLHELDANVRAKMPRQGCD